MERLRNCTHRCETRYGDIFANVKMFFRTFLENYHLRWHVKHPKDFSACLVFRESAREFRTEFASVPVPITSPNVKVQILFSLTYCGGVYSSRISKYHLTTIHTNEQLRIRYQGRNDAIVNPSTMSFVHFFQASSESMLLRLSIPTACPKCFVFF